MPVVVLTAFVAPPPAQALVEHQTKDQTLSMTFDDCDQTRAASMTLPFNARSIRAIRPQEGDTLRNENGYPVATFRAVEAYRGGSVRWVAQGVTKPNGDCGVGTISFDAEVSYVEPVAAQVVCWQHLRTWHERKRPHSCQLHVAHRNVFYKLAAIGWSEWDPWRAHGRGWIHHKGGGSYRMRVDLWRPRWGWAPHGDRQPYFSRARIQTRGETFRLQLDVPRSQRIR